MKLYTYKTADNSKELLGVGYADSPDVLYPIEAFGLNFADMNTLIGTITKEELKRLSLKPESASALSLKDIRLCSPIPRPLQDVLCLGINYRAHQEESIKYDKEAFGDRPKAIYFSKRVSEANYDGGVIPRFEKLVSRMDYEAELGVIIGKDAFNVTPDKVSEYIFGYTIVNDVSARDLQTGHKQWYFGKSLDGYTPIGPCIVTADEIAFPPALKIKSYVNGELRQNAVTDQLITSISEIICELTQGMTLKAGTIIATGTPAGVGMGFDPPKFLKDGDTVTCEIEKIGTITNTVRE